MTERERLYELIVEAENKFFRETPCGTDSSRIEKVVEHLLVNGVILPPCKIGDEVWLVLNRKASDEERWFMVQDGVQELLRGLKGFSVETRNMGAYPESQIGDTVFLTREEAEAALERRKEKQRK